MPADIVRESDLTDDQLDELLEHDVVMLDNLCYCQYGTDAAGVRWLVGTHVEWYRAHDEQPQLPTFVDVNNPPKIRGVEDEIEGQR